ncbi:MAG TPA: Flp pilus assembly protein CpaB [Alphaproteobacteria bacterium]|nr:Flp pilus assembly protein CpaB [Alphaproteobacteria bacterium]
MNRNVVIVLIGGFVIAILVAVLVQASLSGRKKADIQAEAKVEVLVAKATLKIGHMPTEADVKWQSWPKSAIFPGAIVKRAPDEKIADLVKGKLNREIAVDEPILRSALITDAGNNLSAMLDPGMRAVAIDVKANTSVGGFVGPGDYVDIILVYKAEIRPLDNEDYLSRKVITENIDNIASETILRKIKVLAIDQMADRPGDKVKVGKTVTLAVDSRGAETLALAQQMGDLTLSLRGLGDELDPAPAATVTDARLTRIGREIDMQILNAKKTLGIRNNLVRVYAGDNVKDVPSR